mmetsp:Transcript_85763/g.265493  ORF Transcript_85763/g.265493 Transcript_85763/m.265493 type:complete len:205 (+) Transcript_85763:303-917(+)
MAPAGRREADRPVEGAAAARGRQLRGGHGCLASVAAGPGGRGRSRFARGRSGRRAVDRGAQRAPVRPPAARVATRPGAASGRVPHPRTASHCPPLRGPSVLGWLRRHAPPVPRAGPRGAVPSAVPRSGHTLPLRLRRDHARGAHRARRCAGAGGAVHSLAALRRAGRRRRRSVRRGAREPGRPRRPPCPQGAGRSRQGLGRTPP